MNLRYIMISFCFFAIIQPIKAQRTQSNFDFGWKFALGDAADQEKDFNYGNGTLFSKSGSSISTAADPDFKDSSWTNVQLPHDWGVTLPFVNSSNPDNKNHGYKPLGRQYPKTSISWYRKRFQVSAKDSSKKFEIQFDGIFRDAQVWINGFYLGNHKSGYIGIAYDITDFLHFNKENVIVVRVDATQYEGWYYEGAGIYRHAWLNTYAPVNIVRDGIFVYANIKENNALLNIETTLVNNGNSAEAYQLVTFLTDREGKVKGKPTSEQINIKPGEQINIKKKINVQQPILWELDNPYLYRVVVEVLNANKVI